jgi:hypothetical protein
MNFTISYNTDLNIRINTYKVTYKYKSDLPIYKDTITSHLTWLNIGEILAYVNTWDKDPPLYGWRIQSIEAVTS